MALRQYNRNLEKSVTFKDVGEHFEEKIEEELDRRIWNDAEEAFYESEARKAEEKEQIQRFIFFNFPKRNEICESCSELGGGFDNCQLYTEPYECKLLNKKIIKNLTEKKGYEIIPMEVLN